MEIILNFAGCNHAEEKINALQGVLKKEMPTINFVINNNYDTFSAVINVWDLVETSKIIARVLGEK